MDTSAYVGEIRAYPYMFVPSGWFPCYGETLPIGQYQALFSILSNRYGGDGQSTFAVPKLVNNTINNNEVNPIIVGVSQTDQNFALGAVGGEPNVMLQYSQLPNHSHVFNGATAGAPAVGVTVETATPVTNVSFLSNLVGKSTSAAILNGFGYTHTSPATTPLNQGSLLPTGGNAPHNNMSPYLPIVYCICWQGIYPTRD